jgi:REP element-mobilizing transposase RayT
VLEYGFTRWRFGLVWGNWFTRWRFGLVWGMGEAMTDRSFNTDDPLAYFLTWTTYGTWLPGDERGWNRKGVAGVQKSDALFLESAESRMKETAFQLSEQHRKIVENTIRKHCEIRKWHLHAVNARSNHVHVVVTAPGYKPKTVRDQFKAWCTRNLKEVVNERTQFWTEGGSCRSINTEADLEVAIAYVLEAQDRKGVEDG